MPISIHVPTRGTTTARNENNMAGNISIHVPTRGTTWVIRECRNKYGFQSTCLREARLPPLSQVRPWLLFQSTCLREARLGRDGFLAIAHHFNPRAYARHDLPGGDRKCCTVFQSTCLREARRTWFISIRIARISIHVPTRGTTGRLRRPKKRLHFNPRAYARHDKDDKAKLKDLVFQSTCLREARRWPGMSGRRGSISIHVPTRGTTRSRPPPVRLRDFNPRAYARHDDV